MFESFKKYLELPTDNQALPGRDEAILTQGNHFVSGISLMPPWPGKHESILFGMGCFWGAERIFWQLSGVFVTSVGYSGGQTRNPTYQEVCSGRTGHNEVVQIVYDPTELPLEQLLTVFWENHDPTQGMRQGNDRGTQYRSGIYTTNADQHSAAIESKSNYQSALDGHNHGKITTEIKALAEYYFAEEYHQQYLAKNPQGYCGIGGTGIACPIGSRLDEV